MDISSKEAYVDMKVRDLSVQERAIGRIILHSLFMLIMSYTNDVEVMEVTGLLDSTSDYKNNAKNTIAYLDTCLRFDWATLRKLWQVNDEKVLQVIQQILIGMIKEPEAFSLKRLKTAEDRSSLEGDFQSVCKAVLKDLEEFFEDGCDP